jgi:hypothetical protein
MKYQKAREPRKQPKKGSLNIHGLTLTAQASKEEE